MQERKIETMKGMCLVDITKHIMQIKNLKSDEAYVLLMHMELYKLIMDTETNMYLEQNEYLFECCDKELMQGAEALFDFLKAS